MAKFQRAMAPELFEFWLLRPLSTVLGTSLLTVGNPQSIESAANDMVANTWKVLDTAATDEHNGVLL